MDEKIKEIWGPFIKDQNKEELLDLKLSVKAWKATSDSLKDRIDQLENIPIISSYVAMEKKVERYEQALKFYADEDDYTGHGESWILNDRGKTARRALGDPDE